MTESNVTTITPAAASEKRRIVTLTNARPVSILESQWPVVGEGHVAHEDYDHPDAYPLSWSIDFRVRMNRYGRCLIHAKYVYHDDIRERFQTVRVGRLLSLSDDEGKVLLEVAEEMRERIDEEHMKRYVAKAVDLCFESLGPQVV